MSAHFIFCPQSLIGISSDSKTIRHVKEVHIRRWSTEHRKTTLVNALVQRLGFDVPVITEVARQVMQEKGYTREDVDSDSRERRFSIQEDIFNSQLEAESKILDSETIASFLSDRSAIDPVVY